MVWQLCPLNSLTEYCTEYMQANYQLRSEFFFSCSADSANLVKNNRILFLTSLSLGRNNILKKQYKFIKLVAFIMPGY